MPTSMREVAFSFAASGMKWNERGPTEEIAADIALANVKVFSLPKTAMTATTTNSSISVNGEMRCGS